MTWVKLDDAMGEHRRVRRAWKAGGLGAFGLHVLAILHAARYLTDGFVEDEFVRETFDEARTKKREREHVLHELEQQALWVRSEGGWQIRDYLDHNPSRAQILEKRKRDAERKAVGRSTRSPNGVHADSGRMDDGVRAASARPVPSHTRPVPSADAAARAPEVVVRVMTTFASAGFSLQEETVTNAMSRFPAIDLEAEAKGCVEYLRANPGRDAGLTFFRWLDRAKPAAVGRTKEQREADGVAAMLRVSGRGES